MDGALSKGCGRDAFAMTNDCARLTTMVHDVVTDLTNPISCERTQRTIGGRA